MAVQSSNTYHVRIPKEFNKADLLTSIGVGLYRMVNGIIPEPIKSDSETVKARIKLSAKADEFFKTLIRSGQFNNKNEILNLALAYVSVQPKWVRDTII